MPLKLVLVLYNYINSITGQDLNYERNVKFARIKYTEEALVAGCVKNDRRCQEALYRKYFPKMRSMVARYTDDSEIAMEIINNGFLRVFKKIDTFSFKGSLEGWIRRLVFHSVSDYFKRNSKYNEMIIFEERDAVGSTDLVNKLYMDDLLEIVKSVPKASQKVFILYAIDGYTHPEIADQLGISVGTSKWHLSEARKKLKELLKLHQYDYKYA